MRVLSRILSAALTGLALTVTVSCSSGSDDSSGNLGAQFCEVFRPCCVKAGMNGSQSTCRSLYGSLPAGAAAEQCLKDYQEQAKDPAFCQFELPEPESCKSAFPDDGGKKPGESCSSSSDCGGDGTCDKDLDTGKGTCAAFVVVGEGAACVGERNGTSSSWSGDAVNHQITLCDYAAGFHCDTVCKKRPAIGEACTSSHDCVDGAYCSKSVCAAQLPAGATCSGFSDECNDQTYCVDSSKTCEPRRPDGEACDLNDQCLSDYCSDGVCKYNPGLGGLVLAFLCN